MSNQFAAQAYQYYLDKGYSPAAAAGLVGNFVQESGVNPNVRPGDSGTAHGVAQWRFDRYNGLLNYARQNNANPNDLRTQLGYADYEMKTRYPQVYQRLMSARNVRDATAAVALGYERPRGAQTGVAENVDGWSNRLRHAMALAQSGATGGAMPSGGATPAAMPSAVTPGDTQVAEIAPPPPPPEAEPDAPEQMAMMDAAQSASPGMIDETDISAAPPMGADFEMTDATAGDGQNVNRRAAMGKQRRAELVTPLGQLFNVENIGMAGKARG